MLRLVNMLWLLLLLSLILIAVYVSLGRHFLSVATESPQYVRQALEQALDQPVQIGSVQGNWHFLSPSIALHDIQLGGDAEPGASDDSGLHVGFLHVGVDVFRTLLAREVRLSFLHLSGLKVGIYAAKGRIERIEGLNMFKPQDNSRALSVKADDSEAENADNANTLLTIVPRLLQNLLANKGLIFKEIQVTLHTPTQSEKLVAKQLSLVEVGGQYHVQAKLELLEGRPVVMSLHSIMQGQLMIPKTWSGRFYADIDRTPAARWLRHLPRFNGELTSLDLGGALWGEFDAASVTQLTGRVAFYALDYAFAAPDPAAEKTEAAPTEAAPTETVPADAVSSVSGAPQKHLKLPYAAAQLQWQGEIGGAWKMRLAEVEVQSGASMFKSGPIYVSRALLPNKAQSRGDTASALDVTQAAVAERTEEAKSTAAQNIIAENMIAQSIGAKAVEGAVTEGAVAEVRSGPATESAINKSTIQDTATPELESKTQNAQKTPVAQKAAKRFTVQGQALAIKPIAQLMQNIGVLPAATVEKLKQADPQGEVSQFEVIVSPGDDAMQWSAVVHVAGLQWGAAAQLPGLSGLNLTVAANEAGGALWIDIKDGALDLRPNFRQLIPIDHMSVPVQWHQGEDAVVVNTGVALVKNEDATGTAMLGLSIPVNAEAVLSQLPESESKSESSDTPTPALETMASLLMRPRLSLVAGLTQGAPTASVSPYLPTRKMPPGLVRWLDKSLVSGLLESGHFVFEGPLAKLPYAAKTFQMRFIANEAKIDYQAPWPAVTQARVDAFINRREGHYILPYGKVYDADIANGSVVMPYFEKGEVARLKIDLQASGDIVEGLRVLRESPLRQKVETFIDDLQAEGEMAVDLSLDVPLGPGKKRKATTSQAAEIETQVADEKNLAATANSESGTDPVVKVKENRARPRLPVLADVTVNLKSVNVKMPPWNLAVDDVNGPFRFKTGKGIFSDGLTGLFLTQPVTAEIQPVPLTRADISAAEQFSGDLNISDVAADGKTKTQISVVGTASAKSLLAWQGLPILSFLSGEAGYRALVTLFPKMLNRAPNLTVATDLVGMAVDLPAPVGKLAEPSADLSLSFDFGSPRHVGLLAKSKAAMGMRFNKGALDAVRIDLGAESPVLAQTPGLVMTGDTPALFLAPWFEFIERYQVRAAKPLIAKTIEAADATASVAIDSQSTALSQTPSQIPSQTQVKDPSSEKGFDWLDQLKWVDISANALGYSDKLFNQATVQIARIADVWRVTLQGAEISGSASLPMQYLDPDFIDRLKTGRTSASVRERMNARPITLDIGFLGLPAAATALTPETVLPAYISGPRLTQSEGSDSSGQADDVAESDSVLSGELLSSEVLSGEVLSGELLSGELLLDETVSSDAPSVQSSPDQTPPDQVTREAPTLTQKTSDQPLPVLHDGYRRLPPFNLKLRRLFRGGDPWGAWSAQARVTPLGLNFENIKGELHNIVFDGQGAWTASLGGPATQVIGRAFTQDLSATLEGLGFAPAIKSPNATLDVELKWRGRPWDFDLLTAGGELEMAVTDGTLLKINSTASTLRVIGLLNIEMLSRRMQLDFSDVLNKGMQFDLLGGKFDLREGALLTDHIKLRGASAQFDISGQVNLRAKTIDTDMSVTLPVTRNLVLPAAATGGLPAAATAFVIEKALGDTLDKLTTMRFNVAGDWNDPQITGKRREVGARNNRPGR